MLVYTKTGSGGDSWSKITTGLNEGVQRTFEAISRRRKYYKGFEIFDFKMMDFRDNHESSTREK